MYSIGWDPDKARANLEKHGIRFSDAEVALFDPNAITVEDETSEGERRYISIGIDALGRILVVVFSYREDGIRLISVRKATRGERTSYEEGI
ncbi:MAG: BrnT family toxin [Acidobacteriota bacterium]|nr:MAG: BrnT family toxin [Acidobacteriota bacterium]